MLKKEHGYKHGYNTGTKLAEMNTETKTYIAKIV